MRWENVYIFISSTFNDMHAERDFLVKNVFPALSEWCEQRRLHLVDIDLRWGVSEADATMNKRVVQVCLDRIDDCRPFFVCFLGQRRGWVPGEEDVSADTLQQYPALRGDYINRYSITEMEIEHGLFKPMLKIIDGIEHRPEPSEHAFFYLRDGAYLDALPPAHRKLFTNEALGDPQAREQADAQLESWRDRIRSQASHVHDYQAAWDADAFTPELLTGQEAELSHGRLTGFTADGREMGALLIEQLQRAIEARFPNHVPAQAQGETERDMEQQEQFLALNADGFIAFRGCFDALDEYVREDDSSKLLLVTAPAGVGKTMLLSNFAMRLRERDADQRVVVRFAGASDMCSDCLGLFRSMLPECGLDCPDTLDALQNQLPELLESLGMQQQNTTLIIDALNQLDDPERLVGMLPRQLPPGVRLILSAKSEPGQSDALLDALARRADVARVELSPIRSDEDKARVIDAYLSRYFKNLDDMHKRIICQNPASDNPLFLKVLLSELRVFGSFFQLERVIRERFGDSPLTAFDAMLSRMEADPAYLDVEPKQAVALLFGLLAASRRGLSEEQIAWCFRGAFGAQAKCVPAIRQYLRQARPFLARRNGRWDFLYESFRLAASARYEASMGRLHAALSDCLWTQSDPEGDGGFAGKQPHAFSELPYHLCMAGDHQRLEAALSGHAFIRSKLALCGVHALTQDYDFARPPGLRKIGDALQLGAHILLRDPAQLPEQLFGRLLDAQEPQVQSLLEQAAAQTHGTWLRPLAPCFAQPGEGLTKTIKARVSTEALFTKDGAGFYLQGADSAQIDVWDIGHERPTRSFKLPIPHAHRIAISEDGGLMAALNFDKICVYDLNGNAVLCHIEGASWPDAPAEPPPNAKGDSREYFELSSLAFTQDGHVLASTRAQHIGMWNARTGAFVRAFGPFRRDPLHFAVRKNLLAVAEKDPRCRSGRHYYGGRPHFFTDIVVIDMDTGERLMTNENEMDVEVCQLAFLDDRRLATGDQKGAVRVFDMESGDFIKAPEAHATGVSKLLAVGADRLISCSYDRSIIFWEVYKLRMLSRVSGHGAGVTSMDMSPDGRALLTASEAAGEIKLWDVAACQATPMRDRHFDGAVGEVCIPSSGRVLSSSYTRAFDGMYQPLEGYEGVGSIKLWEDHRCKNTFKLWRIESGDCVRFTGDGQRALAGFRYAESTAGVRRGFKSWDIAPPDAADVADRSPFEKRFGEGRREPTFTADGAYALERDGDVISVYDTADGSLVSSLNLDVEDNIEAVESAAVSRKRGLWYVLLFDALVVFDIATGEQLKVIEEVHGQMALNADETRLYTAGTHFVWVYDANSLRELDSHKFDGRFERFSLSEDGELCALSSFKGELCEVSIWQLHDWRRVACFYAESQSSNVCVQQDGELVAFGDASGFLYFARLENHIPQQTGRPLDPPLERPEPRPEPKPQPQRAPSAPQQKQGLFARLFGRNPPQSQGAQRRFMVQMHVLMFESMENPRPTAAQSQQISGALVELLKQRHYDASAARYSWDWTVVPEMAYIPEMQRFNFRDPDTKQINDPRKYQDFIDEFKIQWRRSLVQSRPDVSEAELDAALREATADYIQERSIILLSIKLPM